MGECILEETGSFFHRLLSLMLTRKQMGTSFRRNFIQKDSCRKTKGTIAKRVWGILHYGLSLRTASISKLGRKGLFLSKKESTKLERTELGEAG